MSQSDLAELIGVSKQAVSQYENRINFPSVSTLELMGIALGQDYFEYEERCSRSTGNRLRTLSNMRSSRSTG
jgi:transcriptional regulator with XRE-family HTH domain